MLVGTAEFRTTVRKPSMEIDGAAQQYEKGNITEALPNVTRMGRARVPLIESARLR